MKYLLTLTLLGIVLAGCSARPKASESTNEIPPENPDIANVAPEGRTTDPAGPSGTDSSLPVMTANPSPILLTPVPGNTPSSSLPNTVSTEDWQTFTSTALGVTVRYPPDWSATETDGGATFTSPTGATVQLKQNAASPNSNEFKVGNQYCTSRTNEHGQIAEVCVDNASFTYTATFTLPKADSSTLAVTLMTKTRTVGKVFEAMFNSLQPIN